MLSVDQLRDFYARFVVATAGSSDARLKQHRPNVRALYRDDAPDASCWYAGDGWWLSTAPLPEPI